MMWSLCTCERVLPGCFCFAVSGTRAGLPEVAICIDGRFNVEWVCSELALQTMSFLR